MNKAEREQLKHNEAADAIVAASSLLSRHGRTLALAAVAVLRGEGTGRDQGVGRFVVLELFAFRFVH